MHPEAAEATARLAEEGIIRPSTAAFLGRIARGELVSLRVELRVALYLGVSLLVAGAGALVAVNLERVGPLSVASALALAAAACLVWVARAAPRFEWGEQSSPNLAFDYVLLLGAMLVASFLAFVEARFTPLGERWPLHLLVVAVVYLALAVRYDSGVVFSLALSTFAAWRGVSVPGFGAASWRALLGLDARLNALVCGLLFVTVGWAAARWRRKAHFEPIAAHLGWLLATLGLAAGSLRTATREQWLPWTLALVGVGALLAAGAYRARRFWLFAIGAVAAYLGCSRAVLAGVHSLELALLYLAASACAALTGLLAVHRRMGRRG